MILYTEKEEEYHADGSVLWHGEFAYILEDTIKQYYGVTITDRGPRIRIGAHEKFHQNGTLAWRLVYDSNGEVIRNHTRAYRADGQCVQFGTEVQYSRTE